MINETKKIQSVERTFLILEALAACDSAVPLQQLSQELGINKTTLHGLLNTMAAMGYISNTNNGYRLGLRLGELSRSLERTYDELRQKYTPLIRDMATTTGHTAYLAVPCGTREYIYIEAIEGDNPLTIRSPRGKREGLTTSAIGKLFVALDEEQDLRRSLRKAGKLDATLEQKLDKIVHQRFSIDHGGAQIGLSCMSIPLYRDGNLIAAAGMSGPTQELTTPKLSHYAYIFQKQAMVI
ncbi:IclR family transcriptional regulator [Vibrio sp. HN007]|uniref:IclR family transcriptional regulator n=1 Tax=Vibrio iocasae TaxID=3098914 RepID=UPI0035D46520